MTIQQIENPSNAQPAGPVATGYDFEPLPDGNVLIEFFGHDGKTFNSQVITRDSLLSLPSVASLAIVAITEGVDAVKKVMEPDAAKK
jgi:hypothetical protein